MAYIWPCLGFLTTLVLTAHGEIDKFYKIPLLKCSDSDEVKDPKLKLHEVMGNVTFVDKERHYGPPNCDYLVKLNFTTADAKGLNLSIVLNGNAYPEIDVCKNATPPCSSDGEKNYIFPMVFPAEGTKGMDGDVTGVFFFKKNNEKISCSRIIHYFFQSACCY